MEDSRHLWINKEQLEKALEELKDKMTTDQINNTISANKNLLRPDFNTDDICDGFHTFGQLYYQRMMLFATLVNLYPDISWKTKKHEDGEECFGGGWFLVTIETPEGAYGYHYEDKYYDIFKCKELDRAKHWDGYTEEDVTRLFSLIETDGESAFKNGVKHGLLLADKTLYNRCHGGCTGYCGSCDVRDVRAEIQGLIMHKC